MNRPKTLLFAAVTITTLFGVHVLRAIEIPLESLAPVRIGYVDLQRVFDTYPEKSFAEGDLLKEIERRKRELSRRQQEINVLRQQIAADQDTLNAARSGQPVRVPANAVIEPEPPAAAQTRPAAPAASTTTVRTSSAAVEAYPTDDPLAGLPGHEAATTSNSAAGANQLPGMQTKTAKWPALEDLSTSSGSVTLNSDAVSQLEDRINAHQKTLDRSIGEFKSFRTNAVGDMKQLQTQKTYGVMAKIYATLQTLARDEGITVVLDKAYVLYGEDSVDLSDKLISRLQQESLQ